jgi:hypothetical protein
VSFAAITLCVASQRVFNVVSVYFVIDSVRKLLYTISYLMDTWEALSGTLFQRIQRSDREADLPHLPSARLRMRGDTHPVRQYVFMAWYLVKHRDKLTFTVLSISLLSTRFIFIRCLILGKVFLRERKYREKTIN